VSSSGGFTRACGGDSDAFVDMVETDVLDDKDADRRTLVLESSRLVLLDLTCWGSVLSSLFSRLLAISELMTLVSEDY